MFNIKNLVLILIIACIQLISVSYCADINTSETETFGATVQEVKDAEEGVVTDVDTTVKKSKKINKDNLFADKKVKKEKKIQN